MFSLIYKLLKALNSAQSPWQVSLALSFGILSGLLPLFTPFNLLILFVIFSLNIPIGLYFASLAIFTIIGFFLDPILSSVGYVLLNAEALNPLWTTLYNNPITLWSSFNYTTVMGALALGIPLGIIGFFIFKKLIPKYREKLELLSQRKKYLAWLNPYSEKSLKKKPGVIRWWGSLGFVAVFSAIISFFILIFDPMVRFTLEKTLSTLSGKDVAIKNVDSTIGDLKVEVNEILVRDRGKNLFSLDSFVFSLDPTHALEKKLDIVELSFNNLRTDLQQITAEKQTASQKSPEKKERGFDMPSISLPTAQEILEKEGITTLKEFKKIEKDSKEIQRKWERIGREDLNDKKVKEFERRFNALKKIKVKDANSLQKAIKEATALKKDIDTYIKDVKSIKKEFDKDYKKLASYAHTAKTLPKKEYEMLVNKYSNLESGSINFVGTYISPTISEYLQSAIWYYDTVEPYLQKAEEVPEYQRSEGQWIHFANTNPYPRNYIRVLKGNLISHEINFDIKVEDITDNQKILNIPTTGVITSKTDNFKSFQDRFTFDTTKKAALITNRAVLKAYKKRSLVEKGELDLKNSVIDLESKISIRDYKTVEGGFLTDFTKTSIFLAKTDTKILKALDRVLKSVDSFNIEGSIKGEVSTPKLTLKSDIDKKISQELNQVIKEETKKFERDLKRKIQKRFSEELKRANINPKELDRYKKLLNSKEGVTESLKKEIAKKYSQKALKKQIGKKLEEQAKEKLKNLLKF